MFIDELQWGRRNYPAETSLVKGRGDVHRRASMGPPELPGGNALTHGARLALKCALQWGRRNYPAETSLPGA